MDNLGWLWKMKKEDEEIPEDYEKDFWRNDNDIYVAYRTAKALEIIAEELYFLNHYRKVLPPEFYTDKS